MRPGIDLTPLDRVQISVCEGASQHPVAWPAATDHAKADQSSL